MAQTKVVTLIERAKTLLQDDTSTRWPESELLDWLNAAQLAVVERRPDANTVNTTFVCVADTQQTLPDAGLQLIKVIRNSSDSRTVIRQIAFDILDDQLPDWHSNLADDQVSVVKHFLFDPRTPKTFYVYPCPVAGTQIDIAYSAAPDELMITDFEHDTTTITLDDTFAEALLNYMLHRAYLKDASYAANESRAMTSYQAFTASLGDKTQADSGIAPKPHLSKSAQPMRSEG